jgi:nitrite reductase/ring-hydroxylating ferredoxin subunit
MMEPEQNSSAPTECENCNRAPKWRTDFPIDWEGDHYVSRREMVKFLTLGSVLLAAANWVTALAGKFLRTGRFPEKLVGSVAALDSQRSILFRYPTDRDPCIAVRTPEGTLVAYSQVCTHLSCAVVYSTSDNKLLCPCHNGSFSVIEGAPIGGPPTRRLPRIAIEKRGDQLFATGVEV